VKVLFIIIKVRNIKKCFNMAKEKSLLVSPNPARSVLSCWDRIISKCVVSRFI
jgi:hypothetical protein